MAAAAAAVLRGARSGSSARLPIAAVFRRMAQEGVAQGSSPAAPAAGMGRLLHTGPRLPLGRQAFSSQRHKNARMEHVWENIKSFVSDDGHDLPCRVFYMLGAMSMGILLPNSTILKWLKGE